MLPSLILSSLLVCACGAPLSAETRPIDVAPTPHCLSIDDTEKTIALTADELRTYTFVNLANYLNENQESLSEVLVTSYFKTSETGESDFTLDDYQPNDGIYYYNETEEWGLWLPFNDAYETFAKWCLYQNFNATDQPVVGNATYTFDFTSTSAEVFTAISTAIRADLNSTPSGAEVVTDIVSILVSGLTTLGTGIGSGVANFAQALAFDGDGLSVYFVLVLAFAGVSLAVGLTTKIFDWLSSLGN